MKRYGLLAGPLLLFVVATSATAQEGEMMEATGLDIAEAVLTSQVSDRVPVDTLAEVSAQVGTVYAWTRIVGAEGETMVEHVWYRTDEEMARVQLTVGGSNWRTWSSKQIEPSWTGAWRVDVVGPDGTVLESINFTVVDGGPMR